jgi:hypothetical protein
VRRYGQRITGKGKEGAGQEVGISQEDVIFLWDEEIVPVWLIERII